MAELTEVEALKVMLADKQIMLDRATHFEGQTLALLRALLDGSATLPRLTVTDNSWTLEPAVVAEANQVAQDAQ